MASRESTPRRSMNRWEGLAMLSVLAFLNYMDRNLLPPLLALIHDDLGLDEAQLGALSTGFLFVYMLSAPLVGYVADRVVRKTILLVAMLAWSIVTALSGAATGLVSLLVWRSLTG